MEYPTDPVEIIFSDGVKRSLRFTAASARRLKKIVGQSLMRGGGIGALDEDHLPDVLFEGLVDKGELTSGDDVAELLDTRSMPYLLRQFAAAWVGSLPEAKPGENPPIPASPEN